MQGIERLDLDLGPDFPFVFAPVRDQRKVSAPVVGCVYVLVPWSYTYPEIFPVDTEIRHEQEETRKGCTMCTSLKSKGH